MLTSMVGDGGGGWGTGGMATTPGVLGGLSFAGPLVWILQASFLFLLTRLWDSHGSDISCVVVCSALGHVDLGKKQYSDTIATCTCEHNNSC